MGRKTSTPVFSVLFLTLLAGFTPIVRCDGPLILQQMLLSKNSTDTHAVAATFGNPPQAINLIISTTSDRSWVYAPSFCESLPSGPTRAFCQQSISAGGGRAVTTLFDPNDSTSWQQAASEFSYNGPNNQQKFVGLRGTDKVVIGGIEVPQFEFGVVTGSDVDDDEQRASLVGTTGLDGGIGGVLGLGGNSNFLKFLVDQGLIESSSIGVQLASKVIFDDAENVKKYPGRRIVPLGTEAKEFPGNIVLGGYDAQKLDEGANTGDGLSSQNEIETTVTGFYSTWFDGANTESVRTTIEYQASVGGGGGSEQEAEETQPVGIQAVIDSTSPFVLFPRSFWEIISVNWNRGSMNATTGRAYYTNRDAFRDWRNFTFDLVNKDGQKSQVIMQHFDWNVWDPEAGFWAPAFKLQPEGVNTMVLGRPAMRALYVAVDWDKKAVKTQPLKERTAEKVDFVEVVSGGVGRWIKDSGGALSSMVMGMVGAAVVVVAGGGLF